MGKTAPIILAIALLTGSQIGCRSCGGGYLDYASPVAGCACASCEEGCRAGSACSGGAVSTTVEHVPHQGDYYGGHGDEVIIGETIAPIPAPPQP